MACWETWDALPVGAETTSVKTVLETVAQSIRDHGKKQKWSAQDVNDVMVGVGKSITSTKIREFPNLAQNEDLQEVILVAELWATANWHTGIARFDDIDSARAYILNGFADDGRLSAASKTVLRDHDNANLKELSGKTTEDEVKAQKKKFTWKDFLDFVYSIRKLTDLNTLQVQALAHYISGMCTLGQTTADWRRSRQMQMRQETKNLDLELKDGVIKNVWDSLGTSFPITEGKWGQFFSDMREKCKAKKLVRLMVTCMQAARQGCTVLTIVQDAMDYCPDFNWGQFVNPKTPQQKKIKTELDHWKQAYLAMVKDEFVRFEGRAGISMIIANLGYMCKKLMLDATGTMSLANYRGLDLGNATISLKPWIDRIVRKYIDEKREAEDKEMEPGMGNIDDLKQGMNFTLTLPGMGQ